MVSTWINRSMFMKCLKLIFCLLYLCCSLAEAKEVQVDAQKEVDEMTGRLVASYLEAKVDEEIGRASCREECRSRWSPYH